MSGYCTWADSLGRASRLRALSWNADRARMLAAFQESDFGRATLVMTAHEVRFMRSAVTRARDMSIKFNRIGDLHK